MHQPQDMRAAMAMAPSTMTRMIAIGVSHARMLVCSAVAPVMNGEADCASARSGALETHTENTTGKLILTQSSAALARPNGNTTGVSILATELDGKRQEILIEAVIAEARERGLGYLIVHPSQRAYPLYERLGFGVTDQMLYMDLDRVASAEPPE